jgi:SAM-dependent methyltransferase
MGILRQAKRLNLGSGGQPLPGFTNVDLYEGPSTDEVVDLNGPWPWADESVDEIFTSHCVEHLDDVIHFMREAHRVMRPGATMEIRVPYGWNTAALGDPTHKRMLYPCTFAAFCDGYGMDTTFNPQHAHVRWNFKFRLTEIIMNCTPWVKRLPFFKHYYLLLDKVFINIIAEFRVRITKTN